MRRIFIERAVGFVRSASGREYTDMTDRPMFTVLSQEPVRYYLTLWGGGDNA